MHIRYFTKKTTRDKCLLLLIIAVFILSAFIYKKRFVVLNHWHITAFVNGDFYQIKKAQMYFFDRGPICLPFLIQRYHLINSDTAHKAALLSLIGTLSPQEFYRIIQVYSHENYLVLNYYDYKNILEQLKQSQLVYIYTEYNLAKRELKIKKSINEILQKKQPMIVF